MDKLAAKLAGFMVKNEADKEERVAIYQTGLCLGMEFLLFLVIGLMIAICIHSIVEYIVAMGIFLTVRSYAGGIHLQKYLHCLLCSCTVICMILLCSQYVKIPSVYGFLLIVVNQGILRNLAPVDCDNKRLEEEEYLYYKNKLKKALNRVVLFSFLLLICKKETCLMTVLFTVLCIVMSCVLQKVKEKIA